MSSTIEYENIAAPTEAPRNEDQAHACFLVTSARKAHADLEATGYAIVPNILSPDRVKRLREMFFTWFASVPGLPQHHAAVSPHSIFKYHEVGHAPFMWQMRVWVADFWRAFYEQEVTTSFDGCCYVEKTSEATDNLWTHTDQRITDSASLCVQGFAALTANRERTLVVYPGSHRFHADFGATVVDPKIRAKSFVRIPQSYLDRLAGGHGIRPVALKVPVGALALWDSRVFHQNRYGRPGEERLVLYTCMLPREAHRNSAAQRTKRVKYFRERRTTSHWPYRIKVNSKQPRSYGTTGDKDMKIDYAALPTQTQAVSEDRILRLIT